MRVGVGVIGLLGLEKNVLAFVVDGYLWPGHCVNRKRVRPTAFSLKYVGGGYRPRANRYRVTHAFRMSITSPCGQEGVFNKPWHANIFKKQVQTTCEFLKNGEIKKRGASGSASLAASAPRSPRCRYSFLHRILVARDFWTTATLCALANTRSLDFVGGRETGERPRHATGVSRTRDICARSFTAGSPLTQVHPSASPRGNAKTDRSSGGGQPYRPAANRPGIDGRRARVQSEGAGPEASRDERAREQQNVLALELGRCTGGRDSRLGRGRGARYR